MDYILFFTGAFLVCALFISIIIYFGRSYFIGAPYAVTTPDKTRQMIEILESVDINPNGKKAVDLGSGDGRIVIALAKAGYEAHGYESNIYLVWLSRWKIKRAGLKNKAVIHKANYWKHDLNQYDVVLLFGVFYIMKKLKFKLEKELRPGSIVISNFFKFPEWQELKEKNKLIAYKR